MTRQQLEEELTAAADETRAAGQAWFFKTGPGQYGEGDRFLGITVPAQRKIALRYRNLPLEELTPLLKSGFHEYRFCALEILVAKYEGGGEALQEEVFQFYLKHTDCVNNWDLVDTSAPYIVGAHLQTRPRKLLNELAKSASLWERRIAMVSTLHFIRQGEVADTFRIAKLLLSDRHDLIQKAVGWMLREVGKVSRPALLHFLQTHYKRIPRTALRYAIEHFSPAQRKQLLAGNFAEF
jgi:3-methyladenine DNA glycosylase AlkD